MDKRTGQREGSDVVARLRLDRAIRKRLGVARGLARLERRSVPSRRRPDLWLRGFLSDRADIYPAFHSRRQEYVSDWAVEMRQHAMNSRASIELLRDKTAFAELLERSGFGDRLPVTVGQIRGGVLELHSALGGAEGFIIKPRLGSQGRDVRLVAGREELVAAAGEYEDGLVQRRVVNHAYAAAINPGSLNTIRVLAMRDPVTSEPFVGSAVHRFGSLRTGCVDSFSQGGFSSLVDLESGVLGALAGKEGFGLVTYLAHPDSGVQVAGVGIPHWEECKSLVVELMRLLPGAVHVGWDIAITPHGPLVVEANGYPYLALMQEHGPTLLPRAVEFYRYYGLLKRPAFSAPRADRTRRLEGER